MRRFALVVLLACPAAFAQGGPELDAIGDLEARLLAARQVRVESTITASGAMQASLQGYTELRERNRLDWRYTGTFAGKPVVLSADSDGRRLEIRVNGQSQSLATGPESNRAMLLGMTRMGLLHNLAMATGFAGPDHAEGGISEWLTLDNFRPATVAQSGDLAGIPAHGFDLLVDGQFAATVQLWLESETGWPRRRQQTVEMPQGEMTVVETYTLFKVE